MELLDQLESRIGTLLSKIDNLSTENAGLKSGQEDRIRALTEENAALRQELEQERSRNNNALTRIQALVERIKEQTDQE